MTQAVFWFFACLAVLSALLCIVQRNIVSALLWLVATMFALAAIFVLLNAQFLGAIQVLVYAGAILVLFLFVIMLLNVGHAPRDLRAWPLWLLAVVIVSALGATLLKLADYTPGRLAEEVVGGPLGADPAQVFGHGTAVAGQVAAHGVVGAVAAPLFQQWLVPFELTSLLLLAAIVGAVVLAKRRL
ncbi:MAG TPA: NADH-quinone oxidoreductase subunit J [Gemmatimonadales bacterium]|nr:NADH-quinone oxidoreductase subunit J [Gemmatimonadales bacterium]